MTILQKALIVACDAHEGQKRRNGEDFIVHPLMAMANLVRCGVRDENILAVALLHDVVEDTKITNETIEKEFGAEIAGWVKEVTKVDGKFDIQTKTGCMIKMADRIHNLLDCEGDMLKWYPRNTEKLLREYGPFFQEANITLYNWLIRVLEQRKAEGSQKTKDKGGVV